MRSDQGLSHYGYQVEDTNTASIRLAEAAGLTLAVKLEHWMNYIEEPK